MSDHARLPEAEAADRVGALTIADLDRIAKPAPIAFFIAVAILVVLREGVEGLFIGTAAMLLVLYGLLLGFVPRRIVKIDADGLSVLFDRRRGETHARYAWDEIADVYPYALYRGKAVRVAVLRVKARDTRAATTRFPNRLDRWRQRLGGLGRSGVIIQMPEIALSAPLDESLREIERVSGRHWPSGRRGVAAR